MSRITELRSLEDKRKRLFCQYVSDLDKPVAHLIATKIVHRHYEDEFIKSWQKLVGDPKERLVISKPENIKFYDNCKKLVDSISKVHFAEKEIPERKPHCLLLKKILEIDNQIRLLKKQQSEKRSTSK